jgi:hypothetical protein
MFNIFKSEGTKRNISAIFGALSAVAVYVPVLQPYLPILATVAGLFGVTGIGHAAIKANLTKKK